MGLRGWWRENGLKWIKWCGWKPHLPHLEISFNARRTAEVASEVRVDLIRRGWETDDTLDQADRQVYPLVPSLHHLRTVHL